MEARRPWNEIFNVLGENNCHQVKVHFTSEDKTEVCSGLHKHRRLCYQLKLTKGNSEGRNSDKRRMTPDGRSEIGEEKKKKKKQTDFTTWINLKIMSREVKRKMNIPNKNDIQFHVGGGGYG